jgi:hypothetical protein
MVLTPRRYRFGRMPGDWTGSEDENGFLKVSPNHVLHAWTAQTGGSRILDLRLGEPTGQAITEIITDAQGSTPVFYGPVGRTDLWIAGADAPNERFLMSASDLADDIEILDEAIDSIETGGGTVETVAGVAPVSGDVPATPLKTALSLPTNTLSRISAIEGAVVVRLVQSGAGYPPRPSWATYADFIGDSDPAGAAVDGDIWFQPEAD